MISLQGTYTDGITSRSRPARLELVGNHCRLLAPAGQNEAAVAMDLPLQQLQLTDRIGDAPRRVVWGTAASFTTMDNDAADRLQQQLGGSVLGKLAHKLERNLPVALLSLLVVTALLLALLFWGVPNAARELALRIPDSVSTAAARQTMAALDELYFEPSKLSSARQQQLRAYLTQFDDYATQIDFRVGGQRFGANAFALPAGYVVITDELISLAQADEETLSVYLHEVGHARAHHAEAALIQSSTWLVLLTLLTGDISGISEAIFTLPVVIGQLAFSRQSEREADDYAVRELQRHDIDLAHFTRMLERLQGQISSPAGDNPVLDKDTKVTVEGADSQAAGERQSVGSASGHMLEYLSSHPATAERLRRIRAAGANASGP